MRNTSLGLVGAAALLLLSACDFGNFALNPIAFRDYGISSDAPYFEFTTSTEEGGVAFESESVPFTIQARPGSIGADFVAYNVDFRYADGSPIYEGDSDTNGTIYASVQPGLTCVDDPELPNEECSINSPKAQAVPGPPASFILPSISGQLSYQLFCDIRTDVDAHAWVKLFGIDDLGREFELRQRFPINSTGSFLPPNFERGDICP